MKNFLLLEPKPPSNKAITIFYYLLQLIAIGIAITIVIEGLSDPFGGLIIVGGIIILVFVPFSLRIFFGILMASNKKSKENK